MEDTTMKKTYKNPELEVVKVQTMQMLAASARVDLSNETIDNESDLLGRGSGDEW